MSAAGNLHTQAAGFAGERGTVLIIHREQSDMALLTDCLQQENFSILQATDAAQAISLFQDNSVHLVIIEAEVVAATDTSPVEHIRELSSENFVPIVALAEHGNDAVLQQCSRAGVDDYIEVPFTPASLHVRTTVAAEIRELQHAYKCSVDEQLVGRRILSTALSARNLEIDQIACLSRSAAVFSGDLTLIARQPDGKLHVLLADFTGHGLSAAIGVLPVADTFSVMTEKGFEPDVIMQQINSKLHTLLPTGMFMAAALLQLDNELKFANVWNAAMPDVYVIDYASGHIRQRIGSSCVPLGIGEHLDNIRKTHVNIMPGDQFVLHTDGLTDSINASGEMFSVERFERILNRSAEVDSVFELIVRELDAFCGDTPLVDDVSVITVPCIHEVVQPPVNDSVLSQHVTHDYNGSWRWMMELSGASLHDVDPVPVVIHEYNKLTAQPVPMMQLHNVLTELYRNALEYGVFRTVRKQMERTHRCNRDDITNANLLDGSFVRIELQQVHYRNRPAMLIRVEDSGRGFDHQQVMKEVMDSKNDVSIGYGLKLVVDTCDSVMFNKSGNMIEAVIVDHQIRDVES